MNPPSRIANAWSEFWFAEGSTQSLGLLRIFYGITIILKCTGLFGIKNIGHWKMAFPKHRTPPISEPGDLYRDPVPGFDWIPAMPPGAWEICETIALVAAILWTLGLFTRSSGIVVWLYFAVPMLHSRFDYWHHLSNFNLFLMLLVFLPVRDHYSLDRRIFRLGKPDPPRTMMSIRMVQVLLTWVYISTLVGKLNSGWFNGTLMSMMEQKGMFVGPFKPLVMSFVDTYFLSIYTLFAQALFLLLIWTRYRRWAFFIGATFHLGIDSLMSVTTFSYQMISLYICFIKPRSGLTKVYFDGASERHRILVQIGQLLNWFDRITWYDIREDSSLSSEDRERMLLAKRLVVERVDGHRLVGVTASREILGLLPATFLPAFVLEPFIWFRGQAKL